MYFINVTKNSDPFSSERNRLKTVYVLQGSSKST